MRTSAVLQCNLFSVWGAFVPCYTKSTEPYRRQKHTLNTQLHAFIIKILHRKKKLQNQLIVE